MSVAPTITRRKRRPQWSPFLVVLGIMLVTTAPAQAQSTQAQSTQSTQAASPTLKDVFAMERIPMTEPCRVSREEMGVGPEDNLWVDPLTEDSAILFVTCEVHAYQVTEEVIRLDRMPGSDGASGSDSASGAIEATLLAFPSYREREGSPEPYLGSRPVLVGLSGELMGSRLRLFNKARGIGDCGDLIDYDLAGPIVRIERYLGKHACDGVGDDPETWPPVESFVLNAFAPAVTDRRFARLLHAAMLRLPRVDWLTHGLVRGDLNGDGREEQWVGGYSRDWEKELTSYHLVMEQDGELRLWDIPTELDVPGALCQPIVDLTLWEEGRQILLESRICPPLRIAWDAARDDIRIFEE